MRLDNLALRDSAVASSVKLKDGTTASAKNDDKALSQMAIAVLFHVGATGTLKILTETGAQRTIDSTKWAQGVWHLICARQVFATGSTIADTAFELGWG